MQSPNCPTNSLIYLKSDMLSRNGDSELTANVEFDRQRNFGISVILCVTLYAVTDDTLGTFMICINVIIRLFCVRVTTGRDDCSRADYKLCFRALSFRLRSRNICTDAATGTTETNSTMENDFRDIAKTFLSLRIFFRD